LESITSSKAITKKQIYCLETLGKASLLKNFYLAGGTALAILLNYRKSVDLNFFTPVNFKNDRLIKQLFSALKPKPSVISISEGTLYIMYNGVQISFIHYPYKLIDKRIHSAYNIDFAGLKDIAAMKLSAVTGRTAKKDFIDIYFLLKETFSFEQIIFFYLKKYGTEVYNEVILTKSLMAFDIYDEKKSLLMLKPFYWTEAKNYVLKEAAKYFKDYAVRAR
jgi:predicted nucleotidyltransferase component of viral defense system